MRVLVIEDDPGISAFVARGLTEAGFTETAVHSAPPGYAVYASRVTSQ